MFMGSKRFIGYEDTFAGSSDGDVYTVIVTDSDHYDYTDFTLLHRQHVLIGAVDGRRMLELVNAYTLAFFNQYLFGAKQGLLEIVPSPYPEAEFQAYPGKSR
jgi:hypothetical protein